MSGKTDYLLIGPFSEIITMDRLSLKGPLSDQDLRIVRDGGIIVRSGEIHMIGDYEALRTQARVLGASEERLDGDFVCLPGMIDAHTHICFAGSRAADYAARNAGQSYLEIAKAGGGIWSTVTETRQAVQFELEAGITLRASRHLAEGVTTIEVKSGYGLNAAEELKMLRAIKAADSRHPADLLPTCLAAHMLPRDYDGDSSAYLEELIANTLPHIRKENLSNRVDIFIEESAFTPEQGQFYLEQAAKLGFSITVHADQFSTGGSAVAVAVNALSADHLEASGDAEIALLAASDVLAVALPGASLGLGCPFTPARKLLDAGAGLAIASDWNPGSAPMGDLLLQAAVLGASEKLSNAETWAALTCRAAAALKLTDRGILAIGMLADIIAFPCRDFREILYHQGKLKPTKVWKRGRLFG